MSDINIVPVWGRLIVLPYDIEETDETYRRAKEAGIDLSPITSNEREQYSQQEGLLVAVGGNCFESWKGLKPKEGDKVLYDKYAGCTKMIDGKKYRIISDTDILGVVQSEE